MPKKRQKNRKARLRKQAARVIKNENLKNSHRKARSKFYSISNLGASSINLMQNMSKAIPLQKFRNFETNGRKHSIYT